MSEHPNSPSLSPILTTRHTKLMPCPCELVEIQERSFRPSSSDTATGKPSSSDPIAHSGHCGCIDLDDEQPQCYRGNKDEKTQSSGEEDEEYPVSRACQQIISNDLDSPKRIHNIHALAERLSPSHESDHGDASSASTNKPGILEDLLLETGATLQRPSQDFGWDRMESDLVLPGYLGEPYYASPAKPSRSPESPSASPRKRKLNSLSDEGYDRGIKRLGIHAYGTRGEAFVSIAISLTLGVAAKSQQETWRYEWDSEQQSWFNKGAPRQMKELSRDKVCKMLEFLTIEVQQTSGMPPVSLKAAPYGKLFVGLDEKNGRQYIIQSEIMLHMLQRGTGGQGLVTRYMPFYR
ncbi:hypothetical protein BFJ70_g17344 [Fusarium oxysporum]|nr:hypothetical protein BFJ70_g17344 [Fusarium oxysporum]